ncbi:helix-turn-helix transcriptional regulator [Streptomyces sp. ICBB 8177]|nr:helix-turn-helix transcriptional regulator [Streptomyces sp. ICBB 8177]
MSRIPETPWSPDAPGASRAPGLPWAAASADHGRLRERQEALALVATEAARARAGSGRLVLLRGATGTGRTAVLEAVTEDAAARGMLVLRARCSPQDASTPFGSVLKLLNSALDPTDSCTAGRASSYDRVVGERLWRALRSCAARGPMLLAVDDAHLADRPSHRWLAETALLLDRLPVLLVVTERGQYDIDPPSAGLAHGLSPALVRTLTLGPLGAASAAGLVRAASGVAPGVAGGQEWVADCVRAGAGNPLLLRALLDDLPARAQDGAVPAPLPDSCAALESGAFPAAVSWWLESAGRTTADVARALAVVDLQGPGGVAATAPYERAEEYAELVAAMAGADPARVAGWLTAMARLGLLRRDREGRPRYAHPLLRDAVLSGWSSEGRQAAHRVAAEALLGRGEPAETVAGHLLRTGAVGEEWAAGALLDAAAQAIGGGRPEAAMAFLRRALDEPLPPQRRASVLTELGSLEYATGRSSAGIPRLSEAARLPGGPGDRLRAALALGTALAERGQARAAVDVLRDLDEQLPDHPGLTRMTRTASAFLSEHDQQVRSEVYRWLRSTAEHSPGLVGAAGRALLIRYEATAGLTSADAAMRGIRALLEEPADALTEPFLLGTAAAVAQWADELEEAEWLVRRGLAGQRGSLLHPMHTNLLHTRTDIAAARGAYAELLADPGPPPSGTGAARRARSVNEQAHAVVALVETGRLDQALALADGVRLPDAPDSWELNRFLYARGVLRAAYGDPAGALHHFLESGRRQSARDVVSPVVTPWRSAAAECQLALGRRREALVLAEEEARLAAVWGTPRVTGRALRVLGMATGGRRGLELTEQAVELLRDTSIDMELVPALIARGRQLIAAGQRSRARDTLREAAERAEVLGSVRMRTAAEHALRESGARRAETARTGSAALTASERRIADLAAEGRTNAEICDLLHLARRTVETHLTSVYRKLGIRRRTELASALDGPRPAREASSDRRGPG